MDDSNSVYQSGKIRGQVGPNNFFGYIVSEKCNAVWKFTCPISYLTKYRSIPDALTATNERSAGDCDELNQERLRDMLIMFPQFEMKVSSDVCVLDREELNDGPIGSSEGTIRTVKFTVNILDEVFQYVTNYFHFKKPYHYVGVCKDSFRLIFIVAMGMGSFLELFHDRRTNGTTFLELPKNMVGTGMLVEGEVSHNKMVNSNILYITQKDSDKVNEVEVGDRNVEDRRPISENDIPESPDEFDAVVLNL